ncbi:MAG: hypothetical protein E7618_04425 [Ruminococcaceae bacterium]|nr:hypothetical protein [Oscillospiraceae bacterium]
MITNWKMMQNLSEREALCMKVKEPGIGYRMYREIVTKKLDPNAKYKGPEKYRILMPWQRKLATEILAVYSF